MNCLEIGAPKKRPREICGGVRQPQNFRKQLYAQACDARRQHLHAQRKSFAARHHNDKPERSIEAENILVISDIDYPITGWYTYILWPDGIFITKHPKRQQPAPSATPAHGSPQDRPTPFSSPKIDEPREDAAEGNSTANKSCIMLDKALSPIVGLVGHKEYEKCAKGIYYSIQVEDSLMEATKYLKLLHKNSSESIETHLLSFKVVNHLLCLDALTPAIEKQLSQSRFKPKLLKL